MARMYIASGITNRLTLVPCPDLVLSKWERIPFRFLWRGGKPLVRRSVCCQKLLKGGLDMLRMKMCRNASSKVEASLVLPGWWSGVVIAHEAPLTAD